MDKSKKIALMAFSIIVIAYVFYKLIGYYFSNKANVIKKHYSKTYDLCKVLTKCSDHSYTDTDKTLSSYITGKESSNKNCRSTETNLSWRKNFKCQYDDINEISQCFDCVVDDDNKEGCSKKKHDINDQIPLPDYKQCLNIMGTTEILDKEKINFNYGLDIKDLNDDNRKYKGLTDEWWGKHDELYKCLTSHPDYLHAPKQSNGNPGGWDTGDQFNGNYDGYSSSNLTRLVACNACFNAHSDKKKEYKECMNEQAICFQDMWPSSNKNCDLISRNLR